MYVSAKEKDIANSIDILDYLMSIGEPLKHEGSNFYRHMEHDSLVVNARKNFFSWNSKGVNGNAVTYLMNVHNLSFQHAVKKINEDIGNKEIPRYLPDKQLYPTEFDYDVKEVATHDNIVNYLINDRKIDPELVHQLINHDLIKEDIYKNVVFKWKDNKELIGANLQGTRIIPEEKRVHQDRAYFKKVLPTTEEATFSGFSITRGYPEKIYFFEAPVDLLSYLTLNKQELMNCKLISMDGLKEQTVYKTVEKVRNHLDKFDRDISSIVLCVDNDKAGRQFIEKMSNTKYKRKDGNTLAITNDIPGLPPGETKWDWNNELKYKVDLSLKKNIKNENIDL